MNKARAKTKVAKVEQERYSELLALCKVLGQRVRVESGAFRSGFCIHQNEEMLILNRRLEIGQRSVVLARHLATLDLAESEIDPKLQDFILAYQEAKTPAPESDLPEDPQ